MYQLKYNDEFTCITREIPYWNEQDIPKDILENLEKTVLKQALYDRKTKKFYCSNCFAPLDDHYYCNDCHLQYQNFNEEDIESDLYIYPDENLADIDSIEKEARWRVSESYYVFHVIDHDVFLYLIEVDYNYYYNPYVKMIYKNNEYYIKHIFFIEKNGFTDLIKNRFYSLEEYEKYVYHYNFKEEYKEIEYLSNEFGNKVYIDNLEILKDTIYRYSFLWETKEYLKKEEDITIKQLIFIPLYFASFEYLIKLKLFSLAFYAPDKFHKNKSFKKIFGVEKKYLPFMIKNNITYSELEILKNYPVEDIDVIRFFENYEIYGEEIIELIKDYKLDLKKLKHNLISQNLSSEYVYEYLDYISMAKELGYDIKDKNILYPKNLIQEHDKLYMQKEVLKDPKINDKIKALATILKLNYYEDEKYVIFPASSIESLIMESEEQHNCVRTYCDKFANNECQIYFMRKKDSMDTSFVTIEVYKGKIVQARTKFNQLPNKEIKKVLQKWEQSLVCIMNDEE